MFHLSNLKEDKKIELDCPFLQSSNLREIIGISYIATHTRHVRAALDYSPNFEENEKNWVYNQRSYLLMQSPIYDQSGGTGKEYGFVKKTGPHLGWSVNSSLTLPFFLRTKKYKSCYKCAISPILKKIKKKSQIVLFYSPLI